MRRPLLFAFALSFACIGHGADEAPQLSDAWIRETPPNRNVAAGYLTIANPSDTDRMLIGAHSPDARVEVHEMRHEDGMMRMRRLESLAIPAGEEVTLAPGGTHLMLFDVDATRAGTQIEIEFRFEDADPVTETFEVRRPEGTQPGGAHP